MTTIFDWPHVGRQFFEISTGAQRGVFRMNLLFLLLCVILIFRTAPRWAPIRWYKLAPNVGRFKQKKVLRRSFRLQM